MSDIRSLIDNILDDETVEASRDFESLIASKLESKFEDIKMGIANPDLDFDLEEEVSFDDLSEEEIEEGLLEAAEELGYDIEDDLTEEQLDELSNATLQRYRDAAKKSSDKAYNSREKAERKKYSDRSDKDHKKIKKDTDTIFKRMDGDHIAKAKIDNGSELEHIKRGSKDVRFTGPKIGVKNTRRGSGIAGTKKRLKRSFGEDTQLDEATHKSGWMKHNNYGPEMKDIHAKHVKKTYGVNTHWSPGSHNLKYSGDEKSVKAASRKLLAQMKMYEDTQLDELSSKTLKSYVKKSKASADKIGKEYKKTLSSNGKPGLDRSDPKVYKYTSGLSRKRNQRWDGQDDAKARLKGKSPKAIRKSKDKADKLYHSEPFRGT